MGNLIEIVISGKNEAKAAIAEAKADGEGLSGAMTKMGAVSAAAMVGIGVEATKMATEYEASTTRLVTSAGESTKNIDMVRKGMLSMAGQVGTSAEDLSKGMYVVESAGFHAGDGLTVLKAAAQGAKDENAELGTVANAVTDVLVDYHLKSSDAANVTSQMVEAVSHGKTTFEEFSGSMHNILPLASAMHLSFADVSGVLAEMTAHGMSADQASQNMANAMRSLAGPSGTMLKEFQALGITVDEVHQKMGTVGLAGTMQFLEETAKKVGPNVLDQEAALKKLMGTAPGLSVALMTTGENAADTAAAIKGIGSASADAKGNVKGFSEIQDTLAFKLSQLKASFDTLMIQLGQKIIPVVKDTIDWFAHHKLAVEALATVIGGVLMLSTLKWISTLTGNFLSAVAKAVVAVKGLGTSSEEAAAKQAAASEAAGNWGRSLGNAIPIIGGVIAGAAALGSWLGHLGQKSYDATAALNETSNALLDLSAGSMSKATEKMIALAGLATKTGGSFREELVKPIDDSLAQLVSSGHLDQAKQALAAVDAQLTAGGVSADKFNKLLKDYNDAVGAYGVQQREAALDTAKTTDAMAANGAQQDANATGADALAKAQGGLTDAQNGLTDSTANATTQWAAVKKAASGYQDQLDGLFGRFGAYSNAQAALTIAMDDATGKLTSGTHAVDLNTVAGAKNFQELQKLSQANFDVAKNMLQTGSNSDQATQSLRNGAQAIDDLAKKSGFTKGQIEQLNKELYGVPSVKDITIDADTGPAAAALTDLGNQIDKVAGKLAHKMYPGGYAHGGEIGGAATGGDRSGLVWVGEQGPELVRLPTGSTVRSNPDSMAALSAANNRTGGGTARLEWVGPEGDELFTMIKRWIRVNYGTGPNSVQMALGQ